MHVKWLSKLTKLCGKLFKWDCAVTGQEKSEWKFLKLEESRKNRFQVEGNRREHAQWHPDIRMLRQNVSEEHRDIRMIHLWNQWNSLQKTGEREIQQGKGGTKTCHDSSIRSCVRASVTEARVTVYVCVHMRRECVYVKERMCMHTAVRCWRLNKKRLSLGWRSDSTKKSKKKTSNIGLGNRYRTALDSVAYCSG